MGGPLQPLVGLRPRITDLFSVAAFTKITIDYRN
jgi:hypothetical protein